MAFYNNNLGKFFGPSSSYMGYVFIASGIFASTYSLLALTLIIPGAFMVFTYNETIIDTDNQRVRPYTSYSRGSVRFDMNVSDIELLLINRNGTKKIILNKYTNFEDAHKEMEELNGILLPDGNCQAGQTNPVKLDPLIDE